MRTVSLAVPQTKGKSYESHCFLTLRYTQGIFAAVCRIWSSGTQTRTRESTWSKWRLSYGYYNKDMSALPEKLKKTVQEIFEYILNIRIQNQNQRHLHFRCTIITQRHLHFRYTMVKQHHLYFRFTMVTQRHLHFRCTMVKQHYSPFLHFRCT